MLLRRRAPKLLRSRFSSPQCVQRIPTPVLEWFDARLDFENRIPNSRQSAGPIRRCEKFGFDDASPIGEREEFHWFSRDLMMDSLFDHKAAGPDDFTDELAEAIHGAIRIYRESTNRSVCRYFLRRCGLVPGFSFADSILLPSRARARLAAWWSLRTSCFFGRTSVQ